MGIPAVLTEEMKQAWTPLLESEDLPKIHSASVRNLTMRLLEQAKADLSEQTTSSIASWEPVLYSMVRRTVPSLVLHELMGVQALNTPSAAIFAQRVYYRGGDNPNVETWNENAPLNQAKKISTSAGEALGTGSHVNTSDAGAAQDAVVDTNPWPELEFGMEKVTVTAETRALRSRLSQELIQDYRALHGGDAEAELAMMCSAEMTAEINREGLSVLRSIAKTGCASGTVTPGTFDLDADSDGRWSVEKYQSLIQRISKESNIISRETRRGLGNVIVTSADVANALDLAGRMNLDRDFGQTVIADPAGVNFAGVLANRWKVFIDPYLSTNEVMVGYRGAGALDAGAYFCPYQAVTMFKTQGADDLHTRLSFKTRYGIAVNPYSGASAAAAAGASQYFRKFAVAKL